MKRLRFVTAATAVALGSFGCPSTQPSAAQTSDAARRAAAADAGAPAVAVPVPETLSFDAARFGLTMLAEGWRWKAIRRNVTRFDWTGRPPSGDRELLYSFWMERLDETSDKQLPRIVATAAANLSEGEPCPPIEQPREITAALGVDRIVTVCFEPSTFYAKEFQHGVMHGLVKNGALTLVVALSNQRAGVVPLPDLIGARGKR